MQGHQFYDCRVPYHMRFGKQLSYVAKYTVKEYEDGSLPEKNIWSSNSSRSGVCYYTRLYTIYRNIRITKSGLRRVRNLHVYVARV